MQKHKAMISQPMNGRGDKEVLETRAKAVKAMEDMGFEVVDTFFTAEWTRPEEMEKQGIVNIPLKFLAKSLEEMSKCHAVYFCAGWIGARGCRIEHEAAIAYGVDRFYEVPPKCARV